MLAPTWFYLRKKKKVFVFMLNFLFFFSGLPKCVFGTNMDKHRRFHLCFCDVVFFVFWLYVFLTKCGFELYILIRYKKFKSKWMTSTSSRKFKSQNMIVFCLVSLHHQCCFFFLSLSYYPFIVLPSFYFFYFFL